MLHEEITDRILGCLIKVHSVIGPGLPEYSCQLASALEMTAAGLEFIREPQRRRR